ncbi:hypothetical protein E4U54_007229 [Claviceps lovelessii]|nr:hypothetical protein E4U54_007229 [Claviceps lovelessii]
MKLLSHGQIEHRWLWRTGRRRHERVLSGDGVFGVALTVSTALTALTALTVSTRSIDGHDGTDGSGGIDRTD